MERGERLPSGRKRIYDMVHSLGLVKEKSSEEIAQAIQLTIEGTRVVHNIYGISGIDALNRKSQIAWYLQERYYLSEEKSNNIITEGVKLLTIITEDITAKVNKTEKIE